MTQASETRAVRELDIAACIAGKKPAWDEFVRATAGVVHAAVRRAIAARGGRAGDVEDRVQEVYLRLLQNEARLLRTFDPGKASLATWLTIIGRTIVHEASKRRTLPIAAGIDGSEICTPDTPQEPAGPDLPWSILSDQQRTVLTLLFEGGLSVDDVASRLEITPQTVRSAKHKALERLREELRALGGDAEPTRRLYPEGDRHAAT